jgi:glycosyltransferase involved in cell wall biosynthesis
MVKSSRPFFTIGIPTFNRIDLLRQTLISILDQTYNDFEIIISNDYTGHNLNNANLNIEDDRIKIINQKKNLGEAGNMNFILTKARGKYFTWQFDDDIYSNQFLEMTHKFLMDKGNLPCVYTNIGFIYGKTYPTIKQKKSLKSNLYNGADFVCDVLEGNISAAGCCGVFDRKLLKQINGVQKLSKTPIAIHSEFLLIINMVRYNEVGYINNRLLFSRDYDGTFSGSNKDYLSYSTAGKNLLKKGIELFNKYCIEGDKHIRFKKALINIIMEFYIMRLAAIKGKRHIDEIRDFFRELIDIISTNRNLATKSEVDKILKVNSNKKWVIIRIKAYMKWHIPNFINRTMKRFRAKISRLNI